jgi:Predicted membrane protein (DUF2306)
MRRILWFLGLVFCLLVAAYAVTYFTGTPFHKPGKSAQHFLQYRPLLLGHIGGGMVAIVTGPWQFSLRLRKRRPELHRALGYLYVTGILAGGGFGLVMAIVSMGSWVAHVGFAALAISWICTTGIAVQAARRANYARHWAWMVRSFALTLAALTLRIELPSMMIGGLSFLTAYRIVAWSCWVPNLLVAEAVVRSSKLPEDIQKIRFNTIGA